MYSFTPNYTYFYILTYLNVNISVNKVVTVFLVSWLPYL